MWKKSIRYSIENSGIVILYLDRYDPNTGKLIHTDQVPIFSEFRGKVSELLKRIEQDSLQLRSST